MAAALVGGYVASVLFSLMVMRLSGEGHAASVWTANGFLAGMLILLRDRERTAAIGASIAFQTAMSFWLHGVTPWAVLFSVVNLGEAALIAWLAVRFCGARSRRMSMRKLALVAVVAVAPGAMVGGAIGGVLSAIIDRINLVDAWVGWAVPGALGAMIVLPPLLLAARADQFRDFRRSPLETIGLLALVGVVATAVFAQHQLPIYSLLFPLLTLLAFRLGPALSAGAGFLLTAIALPFTALGQGPVMLAAGLDVTNRVRLVQLVVLAAMFTTIATALAVADQVRLMRLLSVRDRAARQAMARARHAERLLSSSSRAALARA
ncbi:MAG TPA: MASE1 domain-containing protein [Caulobacteraceae bacterium]|jgi:integral membrane sensor domain MASE1